MVRRYETARHDYQSTKARQAYAPSHYHQLSLVLGLLVCEGCSCRRELSKLMSNHILSDADIVVYLAIVYLEEEM